MDYKDQPDLLKEEQHELGYVDPADKGLSFANYLIDQIVMVVLINVILVMWTAIAKTTGGASPETYLGSDINLNMHFLLVRVVVSLVITIIYYTICEAAMNGRTLGKLVTGTIAVT